MPGKGLPQGVLLYIVVSCSIRLWMYFLEWAIPNDSNFLPWMVEYAGVLYTLARKPVMA